MQHAASANTTSSATHTAPEEVELKEAEFTKDGIELPTMGRLGVQDTMFVDRIALRDTRQINSHDARLP